MQAGGGGGGGVSGGQAKQNGEKVRGAGRGCKEGRDEMLRGGEGGSGGIVNVSW